MKQKSHEYQGDLIQNAEKPDSEKINKSIANFYSLLGSKGFIVENVNHSSKVLENDKVVPCVTANFRCHQRYRGNGFIQVTTYIDDYQGYALFSYYSTNLGKVVDTVTYQFNYEEMMHHLDSVKTMIENILVSMSLTWMNAGYHRYYNLIGKYHTIHPDEKGVLNYIYYNVLSKLLYALPVIYTDIPAISRNRKTRKLKFKYSTHAVELSFNLNEQSSDFAELTLIIKDMLKDDIKVTHKFNPYSMTTTQKQKIFDEIIKVICRSI